jgi:hypothetical protein
MTKDYCDQCKIELNSEDNVRISFWGSPRCFSYSQLHFCMKCFLVIDSKISKFLAEKLPIVA